jgi:DNA-binding XRE family transcriptional regulator
VKRDEFIKKVDDKIKLIRNEKGYTQDKMAQILGLTKKTLINVEKKRGSLGWSTAVAACVIFKDSEIMQMTFGGDAQDIILSLSFGDYNEKCDKTMGGLIWWNDIECSANYKIQQNIISKHYRILDMENRRICSSFELQYIEERFKELG